MPGHYFIAGCPLRRKKSAPGGAHGLFLPPGWKVKGPAHKPTVTPSVRVVNGCGCHFWITAGEMRFCDDSPHHAGRVFRMRPVD